MAVQWTKNQQRIIDFPGGNLLVAAGAGSGKTAVLTAHIVQKITNKDKPVDLDQLLVVTFTNAAAAEMKDRVRKNLEQRLAETPEDDNLIRQIGLIPSADISTIHSFCLKLIREQFFRLDMDPGFRLGDTGELALMRADILEELFEEQYEKQEQSFLDFRDMYGRGMNDGSVTELLLRLYEYAQSYPYPDQWLEKSIEDDSGWTRELCSALRQQTLELSEQLQEAAELAVSNHFPGKLINVLQEDISGLAHLNQNTELMAYCRALSRVTFGRKPALNKQEKQDALGITEIIDRVFAVRDSVKASIKKLQETYSACTQERLDYERQETAAMQQEMVRLIRLFSERFAEKKKTLGICDFSDLEHMALQILYEDGKPSDAADTYARGYNEILIDEYQDCNLVQEAILYAVSNERFGEENRFMVGDVKQSIYGFRQARPELFLEKYQSYSEEQDAPLQKIELSANFRSRSGVLHGINMLFHQIMTERLGGISYDDKAALNPGAAFPERKEVPDMQLMLLDLGGTEEGENEDAEKPDDLMDASGYNNREHEARMVSGRILELVNPENPFMVYDGALGEMRPACFKDIVILMRSLSSAQESYVRVLKEMGIPVYVENESGYFTSLEVSNVLDYLRILDNPMQDIPLAAVMRSAFGGFSAQELADIRLTGVGKGCAGTFYACCMAAREESEKLDRFFFGLEQYRRLSQFVPIHELLLRILEETGYRYYVSALPQGRKRLMNLDMLVAKARSYEETSYRGLFHFIRYIDRLKTYDMDVDVPGGSADEVDAVRLMTIHKSKGLEFPIVFLSNMNGHFNKMDLNASVLLDEHYGIAADIKNARYRYRMKTLKKAAMRQKQLSGLLEEEMRVLYVAMTRAKELLIMTGAHKDLKKALDRWAEAAPKGTGPLPLRVLSAADCYLDWVVPSVFAAEKEQKSFERPMLLSSPSVMLETDRYVLLMERFSKSTISCTPAVQEQQEVQEYEDLSERLSRILTWKYPDEELTGIHAAMSVSELKRAAYEEAEAVSLVAETVSAEEAAAEPEAAACRTEEKAQEQKETRRSAERQKKYMGSRAAARGTAYHRVLELFDFAGYPLEKSRSEKKQFVFEEVRRMTEAGHMSKEDAAMVYVLDIAAFFETPLAERMCTAARNRVLHAEQPFLLGVPAKELSQETGAEQQWILVRGIIDSYFEEDGGLVLVDYKTDQVSKEQGEAQLLMRYQAQLMYYRRALEAALKKPVKQAYLYSFALGKEIEVTAVTEVFPKSSLQ